ncbi:hypothetical protein ACP70R_039065 [Stipagrostis hirtigluma subsp. patula]
MGKTLDEAVAAFDVLGSARCGPLHLAAMAGKAQMCRQVPHQELRGRRQCGRR